MGNFILAARAVALCLALQGRLVGGTLVVEVQSHMRSIARVLLVTVPLVFSPAMFAQRGSHGSSAGHASPAARSFSAPRSSPALGSYSSGLRAPAAGYYGIAPGAYSRRGYNSAYGGYGYGYGRRLPYSYVFSPYYWPFYDTDTYASYPSDAPPQEYPDPGMMEGALGQQIARLSDEVDQLRTAQQYSNNRYPQNAPDAPPDKPVTLILRSGERVTVQSYAVMGETFWDFSTDPARKIPVSNIDLQASARATTASGGEFPQIDSSGPSGK